MDEADGALARAAWTALGQIDRIVGIRIARSVASAFMQLGSRTRGGYVRNTYRLVGRQEVAPGVVRLPPRWWGRSRLVTVKRLGLHIDLDLRDNLQRVLYFTGAYEPDVRRTIERALGKGDVFVDIGAHIGVHALPVAKHLRQLGGGTVFAFEPSMDAALQLRRTARNNDLNVEVVEFALSDEERTMELRADDRYAEEDLGVLSEFGSGEPVTTVKATSFDTWASAKGLPAMHAVKLDIEGGELAALRGMRGCITRMRPRVIIVETKEVSLARAGRRSF